MIPPSFQSSDQIDDFFSQVDFGDDFDFPEGDLFGDDLFASESKVTQVSTMSFDFIEGGADLFGPSDPVFDFDLSNVSLLKTADIFSGPNGIRLPPKKAEEKPNALSKQRISNYKMEEQEKNVSCLDGIAIRSTAESKKTIIACTPEYAKQNPQEIANLSGSERSNFSPFQVVKREGQSDEVRFSEGTPPDGCEKILFKFLDEEGNEKVEEIHLFGEDVVIGTLSQAEYDRIQRVAEEVFLLIALQAQRAEEEKEEQTLSKRHISIQRATPLSTTKSKIHRKMKQEYFPVLTSNGQRENVSLRDQHDVTDRTKIKWQKEKNEIAAEKRRLFEKKDLEKWERRQEVIAQEVVNRERGIF